MKTKIFNPRTQQKDLSGKIAVGLERLSESFRYLLWEHAKQLDLSPIQIQILIFINYHDEKYRNVSYLAREFNLTKPTISDAVKALFNKSLVEKILSVSDSRSYTIKLSPEGEKIVLKTEGFLDPLKSILSEQTQKKLEDFYAVILELIYSLNQKGIISVQRTCYNCRFFEKQTNGFYCQYLKSELPPNDLRLDCPEFET